MLCRAFSSWSGRTASPYGTSTGMMFTPNALQMPRQRSPHRPEISKIAFSPGATQPLTAASIPPVPDAVSTRTEFFV